MRILYVHSTLVPPPKDIRTDRFFLLSEKLEGDVLQPIWFRTPSEVEAVFGPNSYPVYTVGRFRYHWHLSTSKRSVLARFATFWFYVRKGLQLYRAQRYECIVAYSHMTTGLIAGVLKLLTRSRLIVEVATSPDLVYVSERPNPGWRERTMKAYSDICLHLSMFLADRAHLLSQGQLSAYPLLRKVRSSVFHEFVPVSMIDRRPSSEEREAYILLVGAPWYLKGADVLTKAFLLLAPEYPGVKLKLLGYFPDREPLDAIIGNSPRIEVMKARPHVETLEIIRRATVMALPSRCEGMGRVLVEAMAAGVPLVASDVGGIPSVLRDGENGFLVPVGDPASLCARLRQLLEDSELRRRMGDAGYKRAHGELSERAYVGNFTKMVEATLQRRDEHG